MSLAGRLPAHTSVFLRSLFCFLPEGVSFVESSDTRIVPAGEGVGGWRTKLLGVKSHVSCR